MQRASKPSASQCFSSSDTGDDTGDEAPQASVISMVTRKRTHRHTSSKWQQSWTKYRLKESKKGPMYAHCTVCGSDFSVRGGGLHNVKRHCKSLKHNKMLKDMDAQPSITLSLSSSGASNRPTLNEEVISAELYFTLFITEHNISFSSADHFTRLCKVMFPDSKIARNYSCGQTKTKAIISHALAPTVMSQVSNACARQPFSILCDGGNDMFDKKYFAIIVRFWDQCQQRAVTRFLALPVCNVATGESLFNALEAELLVRGIPWKHVVGFASDSASVMVGAHNSVLSHVKEKQGNVFSMGCVCHLAALSANAGLKVLPFSVDNLLVDIYYHFKHSSKRCQEFSEVLNDFQDIAPMKVLKHCTTRWLSLERAIKRLIELWPALHAYFDRESEGSGTKPNERVKRIAKLLTSLETKLYLRFLAFALCPLNSFNTAFQAHSTKIGVMKQSILDLLRSYLTNFVKQDLLASAKDITTVPYCDPNSQCSDNDLGIGVATRLLLVENEEEIAGTHLEKTFFNTVRLFYQKTVTKILNKFPFKDQTLDDLRILDPCQRRETTPTSLLRLCEHFENRTPQELDDILCELNNYKVMPEDQLPVIDDDTGSNLDQFWFLMGEIQKPGDTSQKRFSNLAGLCKTLLVLPHSNADPERLFSIVQKIDTEQRGSLSPSTIQDLLAIKMNSDASCYEEHFTDELLISAKSATRRSLNSP